MNPSPVSSDESRGTVLVVDDIAANRNLLRETLEPQGYEVLLAASGETALDVASRAQPDLLLLDVNMPGIDGFETCRQLKARQETRGQPIIFITANDGTESLVEAFRVGGVDYVTKPFKAEEVLMRVHTHLEISRLNRALRDQNQELSSLNRALQAEVRRRQQAEQSLSLLGQQQAERFHAGGTLRHDAPCYIERQADRDLLAALQAGEFSHILTSRQMGKSSLVARMAHVLRRQGTLVASLDLAALGTNLTPDQWYDGLIARIGWQLQIEDELESLASQWERHGPVQRFIATLGHILESRPEQRLVLFVDELDVVRGLPFSTGEFFAAIRECYNRRSESAAFTRLTFTLLGVASPSELIAQESMTPFNIGGRIELHDFSWPEILPLARGLRPDGQGAEELLERIYFWTHGHPYLTQKFCRAVAADNSIQTATEVDELCARNFLGRQAVEQDDNLLFVRERLLRNIDPVSCIRLYRSIRAGSAPDVSDNDPALVGLRLSGIVRSAEGRWVVRNRIYERVFDIPWTDRVVSTASADAKPA